MRIAVTGASGMIGRSMSAHFRRAGHDIVPIVRSGPSVPGKQIHWNPAIGEIDAKELEGFDTVIHLAGEPIAGLWIRAKKKRIRESRITGTTLLSQTIANLTSPPRVLLSASAFGFYGSRSPDEILDENSKPGVGFLAEVTQEWERATQPAAARTRVVLMRFGLVLAARGGFLGPLIPLFKLGLGGKVGSGRQTISWIALHDLVRAAEFVALHQSFSGPANFTSPDVVTHAEFVKVLARVLRRPALFTLPAPIARALLGQMADEMLLAGATVMPRKLLDAGFQFQTPELEQALGALLGK